MDLRIRGKRALMLASSSGLGYASAYALAKEGVDVCISSSNAGRAAAAATKFADETGVHAAGLVGDLSDPANMDSLAGAAEDAMGGPFDILFNNHGGPPLRKALEVTADELTDHTNKMLLSLIRMPQLIVPGMVDRKWGRVFMVGASVVVGAAVVVVSRTDCLAGTVVAVGSSLPPPQEVATRVRTSAGTRTRMTGRLCMERTVVQSDRPKSASDDDHPAALAATGGAVERAEVREVPDAVEGDRS